jgi:hypothetical protein
MAAIIDRGGQQSGATSALLAIQAKSQTDISGSPSPAPGAAHGRRARRLARRKGEGSG